MISDLCINVAASYAYVGLNQVLNKVKLSNGRLPTNHDVERVAFEALRCTARFVVASLDAQIERNHTLVEVVVNRWSTWREAKMAGNREEKLFPEPLFAAAVPENRRWLKRLDETLRDDAALARLADAIDADLETSVGTHSDEEAAMRATTAFIKWTQFECPDPIDTFNQSVSQGFPISPGDTKRIGFYAVWCLFFREYLKTDELAFKGYIITLLADRNAQNEGQIDSDSLATRISKAMLDKLAVRIPQREYFEAKFEYLKAVILRDGLLTRAHTSNEIKKVLIKLTEQIKSIRDLLDAHLGVPRPPDILESIELRTTSPFEQFDTDSFRKALRSLELDVSDIRIASIRSGSTIVVCDGSPNQLAELAVWMERNDWVMDKFAKDIQLAALTWILRDGTRLPRRWNPPTESVLVDSRTASHRSHAARDVSNIVTVAAILNGSAVYTHTAMTSFEKTLEKLLGGIAQIRIEFAIGSSDNTATSDNEEILKDLVSRFAGDPMYLATIGTQVSIDSKRLFFGRIPIVFAAVTDPVRAGLVKTLIDIDRGPISGSAYSPVGESIPVLAKIFPQAKLGFVYSDRYAQDTQSRDALLEAASIHNVNLLPIKDTSFDIEHLKADVIFGRYYLTEAFPKLIRISQRPLIAGNDKDFLRGAIAKIADQDEEVGEIAAKILFSSYKSKMRLNMVPIELAKLKVIEVNRSVARKYRVSLDHLEEERLDDFVIRDLNII